MAIAPMLAWSFSPAGATLPGLCQILMELGTDHACCASHTAGVHHSRAAEEPAATATAGACEHHHPPQTAQPRPTSPADADARRHGVAGNPLVTDAAASPSDCACVPMDPARGAEAQRTVAALDASPPRHEFTPVALGLHAAGLNQSFHRGHLKLPTAAPYEAGGRSLFILFAVLLI
jgi:hypothetical protein